MASRKILITGVAGFIGSNLATRLLDIGYHVIGIDNLSAGIRENVDHRVEFHQRDIRAGDLSDLFRNVDAVFHLAAKNCLSDCLRNPVETSDINITGTANVLEHARRAAVRKFIYADSSAEYEGVTTFPSPVEQVAPLGPYAASKRGGALFCQSYKRLFEMNVTILRYFNVYGPAQDWRRTVPPVMSAFILRLLRGERPVIFGTGQRRRDFIYVDDVNDFHLLALSDDRTNGETYNVGSGMNFSILEIYDRIQRMLKTRIDPLFAEALPGEAEVTLADISESLALGWKPRIDLETGLEKTIAYFRQTIEPAKQT